MGDLKNLLPMMGNLTAISVDMGDAQGVVRKIYTEEAIKTVAFVYSSGIGLTVSRWMASVLFACNCIFFIL